MPVTDDFAYATDSSLPGGKVDLDPLGPDDSASNYLQDTEWADVMNAIYSLRLAMQGLRQVSMKQLTGAVPAVLVNQALLAYDQAGDLVFKKFGEQAEMAGRHANDKTWKYFGIPTDGSDGTTAFQNALDYFRADSGTSQPKTGRLILPPVGSCTIENQLTYHGSVGYSFLIATQGEAVFGQTGFQIRWDTGAGHLLRMLRMAGANGCELRGLNFNGQNTAKGYMHWDIDPQTPHDGLYPFMPSSTNRVIKCTGYNNYADDDSDMLAVGHSPTGMGDPYINTQVSEVFWEKCIFIGNNALKGHGFRALTEGNTKNFYGRDSTVNNVNVGISPASGGICEVSGVNFGSIGSACIGAGTIALAVSNCDYEGDASDTSGVRAVFIDKGAAVGNPGDMLLVQNCQVVAPLPLASQAGYIGAPGLPLSADDIVIRGGSSIILLNNMFTNTRGGESGGNGVKVVSQSVYSPNGSSSGCCGSVISIGNWYANAEQLAPIYDTDTNLLTGRDPSGGSYGINTDHYVVSLGDKGGASGNGANGAVHLRPVFGVAPELVRNKLQDWGGDKYHMTLLADGRPNRTISVIKILADKFYSGTNFAFTPLAFMSPGQRLLAWELLSATVTNNDTGNPAIKAWIGAAPVTPDSGSAPSYANIMLPQVISGSQRFGHNHSEQGSGMLLAGPSGFYPQGYSGVDTSGWVIFLFLATVDPAHILKPPGTGIITCTLTIEADNR